LHYRIQMRAAEKSTQRSELWSILPDGTLTLSADLV
jgi:hypothetical protein